MKVIRFSDLAASGQAKGKRVFIRADLNVPQDDAGNITEDTRIRASVPCIRMALDAGAAVMVTSHLGRPTEGEFKPEDSLAPVGQRLAELLGRDVPLVANWVDGVDVKPGSVVLLENCRVNKGEKKNNPELARKMAALCDIFVNDAFGTAHRAEGTTYGIAEYAKVACAGPLLAAEIDAITKALAQPKRPLVANWVDGVAVQPGALVVLENCRLNRGEKKNDPALARKMAALCDVFVNDAFGTAHRAEATTYGIAEFAPLACAGPLLAAEIDALTQALAAPARPLVAIVAGSKVSTKLAILQSLATRVDRLIVGGGIANTFLLGAGLPIGKSLAEPALLGEARAVSEAMRSRGAEVPVPVDVVTAREFKANAAATVKPVAAVEADDLILDIGPKTAATLAEMLKSAGTIVWNGPVGVFEFDAFAAGTETIARAIAASKAFSIAGGGDTLAAIAKYGIEKDIGYISTGGGAFLEMLEGKTLPAIEILERRARNSGSVSAMGRLA